MARARLAIVAALAEHGAFAAVLLLLLAGGAAIALVTLLASLIPGATLGSRIAMVLNVSALSLWLYVTYGFRTSRALRLPPLNRRAATVDRRIIPALSELVDDAARSLSVDPPQRVWLAPAFECAAKPQARGYDLVLGLALLDALDAEEIRGHVVLTLAQNYGDDVLTARAYRAAVHWFDVLTEPTTAGALSFHRVIASFYLARIGSALVEARQHDAEKRARAAAPAVARAVARAETYKAHANDVFWPEVWSRSGEHAKAPDAISRLRAVCRAPLAREEIAEWLASNDGVVLGESIALDDLVRDSWAPASDLLPRTFDRALTATFDEAWREQVADAWREANSLARSLDVELAELERRMEHDRLTRDEAWRRIQLIEQRRGTDEAAALYREWADGQPNDARACYFAGRATLATDSERAIDLLQRASAIDERYVAESSLLIGTTLSANGKDEEAQVFLDRYAKAAKELGEALKARAKKLETRRVRRPDLPTHELVALRAHVQRFPMVASAFISRLEVDQLPTLPCFVIAVRFKRWWSWLHWELKDLKRSEIESMQLPVQLVVIEQSLGRRAFAREPALEFFRVPPEPRSVVVARWGRAGQFALLAIAAFFLVRASVINRDCFPDCWLHVNALTYMVPLILVVNIFVAVGSPDTPRRRTAGFLASLMMTVMLISNGWWTVFTPLPFIALLRAPNTRQSTLWTVALSPAAVFVGLLAAWS